MQQSILTAVFSAVGVRVFAGRRSMKLRIYNARILTKNGVIEGELRTDGDRISYLSPVSTLDWQDWDREIDLKGNLMIPSFKNSHTHSPMTFLRSRAEDMPLKDWLYKQVFPAEGRLTDEDCYYFTRLAVAEYYAGGTTYCCEMYGHTEAVASAFADTGFGAYIGSGIFDFDGNYDKITKRAVELKSKTDKLPRVKYALAMHAQYTCGDETLRAVSDLSKEFSLPVLTHLSETAEEVESCRNEHGVSPVRLLAEKGIFDLGGTGFHCVHVDEEDIKIMKKLNVSAVTCPCSNLKLASGIAPIGKLLDAGVSLGIGTDGAASNNALDMFRETYLATVLQKYLSGDAAALSAKKLFDSATDGKICGVEKADGLYVGALADMAVIDMSAPEMQTLGDVRDNLVYAGGKRNVIMTIAGGKVVYEKGEYLYGEDYVALLEKCNSAAKRILDES